MPATSQLTWKNVPCHDTHSCVRLDVTATTDGINTLRVAQHVLGVAPAGQFAIEGENGELFGVVPPGNVFRSAPGNAVCG
jgi:hypothetical protein